MVRGTAKTAGGRPDRPGRANPFPELAANFYSLRTKKIPTGRGGIKSLIGGLLVPTLPSMETRTGWVGGPDGS